MHSTSHLNSTSAHVSGEGPALHVDSTNVQVQRRALRILREFGSNVTSFQIPKSNLKYWFDGPNPCVAYVDTGRAWVVAGALWLTLRDWLVSPSDFATQQIFRRLQSESNPSGILDGLTFEALQIEVAARGAVPQATPLTAGAHPWKVSRRS